MQGAKMAMASSNPQTYMTQWLQTATNGKVIANFSLMNHRMRLKCLECDSTLTVAEPEGTTIDYGVQEFVKLHAHKPGSWLCYTCGKMTSGSLTEHAVSCVATPWKPVTADFKQIDEKPEKAAKIVQQTTAYDNEMKAKLNDANFAAKIAALQKSDIGKAPPQKIGAATPGYKSTWGDTLVPNAGAGKIIDIATGQDFKLLEAEDEQLEWESEQAEKALSKKKAVENALKIKLLQDELQALQNKQVVEHAPGPKAKNKPPAKDGFEILQPKEGRKFR